MADNKVINILSNSARQSKVGGPNKVFVNVSKGFDRIGQRYVINQNPEDYIFNWAHDSVADLITIASRKIPAIVGPNLVVLPKDLPWFLPKLANCLYLHPSSWCVEVWEKYKFTGCKLKSWPVGIDWEKFSCRRSPMSCKNVMLYIKNQHISIEKEALWAIEKAGFNAQVIKYGRYTEDEFQQVLQCSQFGIWIGTTESQGIALLEALASDLPLIVLNNTNVSKSYGSVYKFPKEMVDFPATSVPYFDNSCGIVIDKIDELGNAVEKMGVNYRNFTPQKYIRNNLSLEISAQKLVDLFGELNIEAEYQIKRNNSFISKLVPRFRGYIILMLYYIRRKLKALINILTNKFNN